MNQSSQSYKSILVIDDNESIHRDFAKVFASNSTSSDLQELDAALFGDTDESPASESYDLSFASQGKEGLEVLETAMNKDQPFGAAFVDMRMPPGWNGVETIEQLWKVDPDLQVVICTAYSDKSWEEIVGQLGHSEKLLILKKPFDNIEVVQLAHSLAEKRKLLETSKRQLEKKQQELTEAQRDAEVLVQSMSNALICLSEDGIISRWNSVASQLFEVTSEDAIGQHFSSLPIEWVDKKAVDDALFDSFVLQKHAEFQYIDSVGVTRTIVTTVCPLLHESKSDARLVMATDVTKQKSMQTQLDQALRMESVGQLAAGVAHEINTPMQYIGDNVRYVAKSMKKLENVFERLPELLDAEVTTERIEEIREEVLGSIKLSKIKSTLVQIPDALNDSIEGVASVSKIVAAMKEFTHPGSDQKSEVCINHVLESTITVAKNEWKYVSEIETSFEKEICKIEALPSELNQAFLNIIVNASHAISDRVSAGDIAKGMIKISTSAAADHVLVTIEDNGGGIPAAVRDKVFEPFFTTKEVGKGTGQGLSVAFTVIKKKHGGNVSFTVEEGVGTTFMVKLPKKAFEFESNESSVANAQLEEVQ